MTVQCVTIATAVVFFLAAIKSVGDNLWVQPTNTLGFGKSNVFSTVTCIKAVTVIINTNQKYRHPCNSHTFLFIGIKSVCLCVGPLHSNMFTGKVVSWVVWLYKMSPNTWGPLLITCCCSADNEDLNDDNHHHYQHRLKETSWVHYASERLREG